MTRALALPLTLLTGFSGLVYEVTWQKYLATLLGSHSQATAAVLGIFLGGLSVGYAVFGRVTARLLARADASGRPPGLLLVYGAVEAAIGVYAFLFPALFRLAQALSTALAVENAAVGFAFDVLLATLLIGPPTVLMGGTIPMLTQALARNLDDATRFHALVYGSNTAGAFLGALAAGFWLVPWLGLVGVLSAMGLVNLAAGAAFAAIGAREPGAGARAPGEAVPPDEPRLEGFASYAGAALLVGFAMMAIQTVLVRIGGLSFGSSHFTFAMVVAVFVLCIALGGFAVSALSRIPPFTLVANMWALVAAFYLVYTPLENSPYWAHVLRTLFRDQDAGFYPYYLSAFAGLLLVIGLPVTLAGAALPLLFHHLRRQVGELGRIAGRLYSWNTVGSLLGALLGGYVLLFWLDLHAVYRIAVAALVGAAALLTVRVLRVGWAFTAAFLVLPTLGALFLLRPWAPDRLASGAFRIRRPQPYSYAGPDRFFAEQSPTRLLFYEDDPVSSVSVKEFADASGRESRAIYTNGKPDGSLLHDYVTMAMAAILPALLAERVERGFVIGFGTGVTVGELAALPSVREVIVAEISRGVINAAPLFEHGNLGASQNPKVRIVQNDAYRALLRSEGGYDVIASEPSNPWVTGVEMLYSREFLEAARSRLNPGGVYAQWFHAYETDEETIALVLRTYASVFNQLSVWYALGPDLLLLGFVDADAATNYERLVERARLPEFKAALRRSGMRGLAALLAHELLPLGVVQAQLEPGPVHTLLHPVLSHRAARAFFVGGQAELPSTAHLRAARIGASNSFLRRFLATRSASFENAVRGAIVRQTCGDRPRECAVFLAEWLSEQPDSPQLEQHIERASRRPGFQPWMTRERVRELARLFEADGRVANGDPTTPAEAKQATELFSRYYHHAQPFQRRALASLWRDCARVEKHAERCAEGRREAEALLGDLDVEPVRVRTRNADR